MMEEPLPIFQEGGINSSVEQMIPQVTVVSYDEGGSNYCNQGGRVTNGAGGVILSDVSDELLIKQLQLNIDEKGAYGNNNTF